MMKAVVVCAMLAIATGLAAADSTNPLCDPSYECAFKYTDDDNKVYNYDLSGLCASQDWVLHDAVRHTYYANICGYAKQNCLPATWTNTYEFGVTVQMWGATPQCTTPKACTTHAGGVASAACCTADCQVLGREEPQWSLLDPTNPLTGGVKASFRGAAPKDSDPFWCTFNPATGAQYERQVHYHFACDESVDSVVAVSAKQNSSNDCSYTIQWKTSKACAEGDAISGGWIFIIILVCLFFVYAVGGTIYMFITTKQLAFPNADLWAHLGELVRDGFLFVGHGFKKHGSSANAGSYDDIGAQSGAQAASFQASSSAYQAAPAGESSPKRDYTDL